jgi:hypothetical protein
VFLGELPDRHLQHVRDDPPDAGAQFRGEFYGQVDRHG